MLPGTVRLSLEWGNVTSNRVESSASTMLFIKKGDDCEDNPKKMNIASPGEMVISPTLYIALGAKHREVFKQKDDARLVEGIDDSIFWKFLDRIKVVRRSATALGKVFRAQVRSMNGAQTSVM